MAKSHVIRLVLCGVFYITSFTTITNQDACTVQDGFEKVENLSRIRSDLL